MITKFNLYENNTGEDNRYDDILNGIYNDILNGDLDAVKKYIEVGGDINKDFNKTDTLISLASKDNHTHIVKYLIDAGVDVNKLNFQNISVLNKICSVYLQDGSEEIIKLLVDAGADLNNVDGFHNTPLMNMVKNKDSIEKGYVKIFDLDTWDMIILLIDTDWNITDVSGRYFIDLLKSEEKEILKNDYPEKYSEHQRVKNTRKYKI